MPTLGLDQAVVPINETFCATNLFIACALPREQPSYSYHIATRSYQWSYLPLLSTPHALRAEGYVTPPMAPLSPAQLKLLG